MGETVVYEIARYDGLEDDSELVDRFQLVSVGGVLKLRDASGGGKPCEGDDVAAVISSTPVLREIREGRGRSPGVVEIGAA